MDFDKIEEGIQTNYLYRPGSPTNTTNFIQNFDTNKYNLSNIINHWNPVLEDDLNNQMYSEFEKKITPTFIYYTAIKDSYNGQIIKFLQGIEDSKAQNTLKEFKDFMNSAPEIRNPIKDVPVNNYKFSYKDVNIYKFQEFSNLIRELYAIHSESTHYNKKYYNVEDDSYVRLREEGGLYGVDASNKVFGKINSNHLILQKRPFFYYNVDSEIFLKINLDKIDNVDLDNQLLMVLTPNNSLLNRTVSPDGLNVSIRLIEDNTWSEEAVNYNNRPTTQVLETFNTTTALYEGKFKFDISDWIKYGKENNKQYMTISLQIPSPTYDYISFYSKEGSLDPVFAPHIEVVTSDGTSLSSRKIEKPEEKEFPAFEEPAAFTIVYPNPTNGMVNVKAEKDIKAWKMVSMSGKMIGHGEFNAPKRTFVTNIGNQSGGLYMIQIIYTDGTSESKKIMKR